MEMASTAGISILVFRVLPTVPAEHGIVIMMGCSLCPSIMNLINSLLNFKIGWSFLNSFAALPQILSVFLWPFFMNNSFEEYDIPKGEIWPIPVAMFLISARWWENYVSLDSKKYEASQGKEEARTHQEHVGGRDLEEGIAQQKDGGTEKLKKQQKGKEGNGKEEAKAQQKDEKGHDENEVNTQQKGEEGHGKDEAKRRKKDGEGHGKQEPKTQQKASEEMDRQNTRTLKEEICDSKVELHLVMSFLKIGITIVLAAALQTTRSFTDVFHLLSNGNKCIGKLTLNEIPGMNADWAWVYMINTGAAMFVYICAANAAKIKMQKLSYALPLTLSQLVLFVAIYFSCQRWNNSHCFFSNRIAIPSYMFLHCHSGDRFISYVWRLFVWFMLLWTSQIIITLHIWYPGPERLTQTDK